jgi:hypothetical protein
MNKEQLKQKSIELGMAFEDSAKGIGRHGSSFAFGYIDGWDNAMKEREWISVDKELPKLIEGKDYSENVFAWCNGVIMIMSLYYTQSNDNGRWHYYWANCYGDINGDGEADDDYEPSHWQSLPMPPKE